MSNDESPRMSDRQKSILGGGYCGMFETVTVLAYTFPRLGTEDAAFAKIAESVERTWENVGRLKTVIVAAHRFAAVERFAAEHPEVELQVESNLVPGDIRTMSLDCIEKLHTRFSTPYVLIVQDDGYPIRAGLEEFVGKYDFIGAPSARDGRRRLMNALGLPCLNGGFSLRSRRICRAAALNWRWFWRFFISTRSNFFSEDTFYTLTACLNPFYRWRYRFAGEKEAFCFSVDTLNGHVMWPAGVKPFGVHGKDTMSNRFSYDSLSETWNRVAPLKTIRFWTSRDEKDGDYWRDWFCLPADEYEFVFDKVNPDYLFVSEHIYSRPNKFRKFLRMNTESRLSVYIGGEAISPDLNLFDYACSFDRGLISADRVIRKPTALFFKVHVFTPLTEGVDNPRDELSKKRGFCNFIYSNPAAHKRRDELFDVLSHYKRVDSLGPHLNNCGNVTSRADGDWRRKLIEMKRPYKFSIAAENARFDGYVTEKLISSFQAHTVPIYWGNPSVAEEFNSKAFINATGLTDDELIAEVRRIDEDDELWCRMIAEPPMTADQNDTAQKDAQKFVDFFKSVFDDRPIEQKKRAPSGYWNEIYKRSVAGLQLGGFLRCLWKR